MKTKMKLTRHTVVMGRLMSQIGEAYRSDIALYLDCIFGTEGSGLNEIRKWEKKGFLNERLVRKGKQNDGDSSYKVLVLSPAGKLFIEDNELCGYYKLTEQQVESHMKDFDTSDMDRVKTRLLDSRVKMAFEAAGAPAFTINKPNLCRLYEILSGNKFKAYDMKYQGTKAKELYLQCSSSECLSKFNSGIYYTIAEVRSLLDTISPGSSDSSLMSRARGIYISKTNCFIVYIPERGNNKNIKINKKSEQNLLSMLRSLLKLTKVRRILPELSKKELNMRTNEYQVSEYLYNSPSALVISDSDNMVFQLGKRFEISSDDTQQSSNTWLVNNLDLYERVYVAPYSVAGIQSVLYLCTHTIEEWHKESLEEFKQIPNLYINDYDAWFPASEQNGTLLTYMPVYELNRLEAIKHTSSKYGILTYSDMVEPISKHLCKLIDYFDIEDHTYINDNTVIGLYSLNGNLAGRNMILDELDRHDLETTAKEINALPSVFGYDNPISFFNDIALEKEGSPMMLQIIDRLETKEADATRRLKKKQISIALDDEFREKLRKASRLYNLSASRYVKLLIEKQVEIDSQKYDDALKEDRIIRKGK